MITCKVPFDIATCMYYTGIDPFSKQQVYVARGLRDRKLQRALMQFFKPENYLEVQQALVEAGRGDLFGVCEGLIPAHPPKEALQKRREQANQAVQGDRYHSVPNPRPRTGYRPGRKAAGRRQGKKKGR